MTTHASPGLGLILTKPTTNEVLHRIELFVEKRHGGRNGTMCLKVENHVDRVEASFCALFHEALYNGLSKEPSDDGLKNLLINTYFRDMDDQSTTAWKYVAVLVTMPSHLDCAYLCDANVGYNSDHAGTRLRSQ